MLSWSITLFLASSAVLPGIGDPVAHGVWGRTAAVMNDLAVRLQEHGRASDAERLYRGAVALCDPGEGVEPCRELHRLLNNSGSLYYAANRYAEAEPLLRRALAAARRDGSPLDVSNSAANLAAVYRAQGRYGLAEPLYAEALQIRETERAGDPRVVILLVNMASLAHDMGQYDRGEKLARRALALCGERINGISARARAMLAASLQEQGRLEEAAGFYDEALAIQERLDGPQSPNIAPTLNGRALVCRLRGELDDAERLYRRALEIFRNSGLQRGIAASLNNLAQTLAARRQWTPAEGLFREAIEISERVNGAEHPETAAILGNLAGLYCARHDYSAAAKMMTRVLEIDRRILPADHPRTGVDLARAGTAASGAKRYGEAEALLTAALRILEPQLGSRHPEVGTAAAALAHVHAARKNPRLAGIRYAQAVEILSAAWSSADPRLLPILLEYSGVLRASDEFAMAAKVDARATGIRVRMALR